jgi:TonB family protein
MNKNLVIGIFLSLLFHGFLFLGLSHFELTKKNFSKKLGQAKIRAVLKVISVKETHKSKPDRKKAKSLYKKKKIEAPQNIQPQKLQDTNKSKVSTGENSVVAKYLTSLRSEIVKNKYKNRVATIMKLKGEVELSFKVIWPDKITDLKVIKRSEHAPLNDSALSTIERIEDIPKLPNMLKLGGIEVSIKVIYE